MLVGWGPHGAHAVEDEVNALLPLSLEELINVPIVTASRRSEVRDHTPAFVVVISREQIRERGYRDLADLLEALPGVDFMRGTRSAGFNNFSLHGYSGPNKLLIMLDGIRIDHPAGGRIALAENYPLYHAKQVEVVYGPAAALYGADAVAGVINIVTEPARDAGHANVMLSSGRFGSHEANFHAAGKWSEQLILSLGGHAQRSDRAPLDRYYPAQFAAADARTFDGELVMPAEQREAFIDGIGSRSLYARLDVAQHLSVGYFTNTFHQLTSTGDRPDTAIFTRDARWQTQAETAYARWRLPLADGVKTQLQVDYSRWELQPRSKYLNIYTRFEDNGYLYSRADRRSIEQMVDWVVRDGHVMQAGIGYQSIRTLLAPDMPRPYDRSLGVGGQGLLHPNTDLPLSIDQARYRNTYAYLQLQSDWQHGVATMAGVRYDHHSGYGNTVNPRIGASWRINEQHLVKLLYGESFRAPSPEEALSSYGSFSGERDAAGHYIGTGFRIPNPDLKPERARTVSLSWDWRPRPNINVVTNVFHSNMRDLIVTHDASAQSQALAGAVLSDSTQKVNSGDQSQTGVDVLVQWRFKPGRGWSADAWGSLSLLDGERQESRDLVTRDLSYIARRKARLGTTLHYRDTWTITPALLWTDAVNTDRAHPSIAGARRATKGYTRVDLNIGRHGVFTRDTSLWLRVENLFDRRYFAAHGSAGTTFVDMPQQPRTWMLTLEHRM